MKKLSKILLIAFAIGILFCGCSVREEQYTDYNNGAALYGPCIFYNGNKYVTPPYEQISHKLPADAEYWGTSTEEGSEQYINGVLVSDVHTLDTDENVQITCINGGLAFYKSADEKRVYTKTEAPENSSAVPYYSCYAMVENE